MNIQGVSGKTRPFYQPDMALLARLSASSEPSVENSRQILARAGEVIDLADIAVVMNTLLSPVGPEIYKDIRNTGAALRQKLFGNLVVPMAPVEISNTCASDCLFCGWRVSNREMKRMRMPADLAMLQVEYLVDAGIDYIEFVSGDDITVVRDLLPQLIDQTRKLFGDRGRQGKVSFCTLALTELQYSELKSAGADSMVVWQETYDPAVFASHVKGGPKAFGISDEWKVDRSGDGCRFRIESQERAMRAGLEVALGSMLGLNPDICSEFLATVDHARYLAHTYGISPEHPLIIGMPIWNAITTSSTDLRQSGGFNITSVFAELAALYLISLPWEGTWVFPNCRVPMATQIEAARVGGAFTSTEVKLGPGGYLPSIIARLRQTGKESSAIEQKAWEILKEQPGGVEELQKALDQREQFIHHYHSHDDYRRAMSQVGLELSPSLVISPESASASF